MKLHNSGKVSKTLIIKDEITQFWESV